MNMKSRLFRAMFEDVESDSAKAFQRHLGELLRLDADVRNKCIAFLPELLHPLTDHQKRTLVQGLAEAMQADLPIIEHSLAVLNLLVKALLSDDVPDDDHLGWAEDIATLSARDGNIGKIASMIQGLVDYRSRLRSQESEERALAGVLPRLSGLNTTVEARGVREERHRWGSSAEDYAPRISGLVYIASVHIGVDEGHPDEFCFQVGERGLDNMIGKLQAAKKDIAALKTHIQGGL